MLHPGLSSNFAVIVERQTLPIDFDASFCCGLFVLGHPSFLFLLSADNKLWFSCLIRRNHFLMGRRKYNGWVIPIKKHRVGVFRNVSVVIFCDCHFCFLLLDHSFILSDRDSQRKLLAVLFVLSPSIWSTVLAFSGSGLGQNASATNRLTNQYRGYPSRHRATL